MHVRTCAHQTIDIDIVGIAPITSCIVCFEKRDKAMYHTLENRARLSCISTSHTPVLPAILPRMGDLISHCPRMRYKFITP